MKFFNPILCLCSLSLVASALYGAAPTVVVSPDSTNGVVGVPFFYEITTSGDEALSFGHAGTLPPGLTRSGNLISGTPTEPGSFPVTLSASNFDGSGFLAVTFEITAPVPEISSALEAQTRVEQPFSYTITATNSPTEYLAGGLDQIGGLALDGVTGIISGTPTNAGNFDVVIAARNGAGLGQTEILNIDIAPTLGPDGIQDVTITSPSAGTTLDGSLSQLVVVAEVTPAPGEEIDTVFIEWINPPEEPGGNPREDIVLSAMSLVSTDGTVFTYSGTVDLGFNPDDREVGGGGDIDLRVRAFQTNAEDASDYGEAIVDIDIAPIMEFVFPDEGLAMDSIANGDIFASVRLSSNNLDTVTGRIAGESILDTAAGSSSTLNGIFTFEATKQINFPGLYEVRVTARDINGNTNVIRREITISDTLAEPVAVINTLSPGFTNEVLTAATLSFAETDREPVTADGVGVVGFDVTYGLTLISGGQGYFPRNSNGVTLRATNATDVGNITRGISGISIVNGRVVSLPETFTTFYPLDEPEWGTAGFAVLDDLSDPGFNGKVTIGAEFFRANAPLREFKIFVNGKNVLEGNLDPTQGPINIPALLYPENGSPTPGDYLVVAQVMDQQGEVGTSEPISFTILPLDPIDITLSRVSNDVVSQGDSVTFDIISVDPEDYDQIETVTIFDADSDEELGTAPKVRINGVDRFRFTETLFNQGSFGVYAEAVAFNGQSVRSGALRVDVQPVNDLRVTLSAPLADQERFAGEGITVTADASSTAGVASVAWLVNNDLIETDTEEPYTLNYTFATTGNYVIRAIATDNFGNTAGSSRETVDDLLDDLFITGLGELNVTVLPTDLLVSLTSPVTDQTIVTRESLNFTATATATLGVAAVRWYVNGQVVETDTNAPYALNFEFPNSGNVSVFAEAEDSLGARRQSATRQITVNPPNPLLRDEDFLADTFSRIIGRAPTNDERAEGLAQLNGDLASRSAYTASLLRSDALQTTTIAQLIYRTMTGEWPDASELNDARNTLTNGGTGVVSADALTLALIPEYEARFAVLNTDVGFMRQIFRNKHGVAPTAQTEVRLYNALVGGSVEFNGTFIPGYGGDVTAYATQFALDNELSGFIGPDRLPLTSLHLYSKPNAPESQTLLVTLVSTLLGVEPTDSEISALSELSLESAVSRVLQDPRYYGQFSTSDPAGAFAQIMAGFGVFDINLNGPDDDADEDGQSNLMEIALGSDPTDAADQTGALTASIDGSDFVVSFLRLSDSALAVTYTVQCSPSMAPGSWNDAGPDSRLTLASDQSDVPLGHERVEFRMDTNPQGCTFVRVLIN